MAITSELAPTRGADQAPQPDQPSSGDAPARRRWPAWRDHTAPRPGQSLVEIALIFPPVLMLLLIAANVGLAVHTHTMLAQATQQAAQIFLHHPETTANCNDDITGYSSLSAVQTAKSCYADDVAWYLHNHGFSDITQPSSTYNDITVTPSADCESVTTTCSSKVLTLSLSVEYGFPLVAPVLDNLSFGPLQNGRFNLGAVASTIGEVPAPQNVSVTLQKGVTDAYGDTVNQYVITWQAPTLVDPDVTLAYCIYAQGPDNTTDGPLQLPCGSTTTATVSDPPDSVATTPYTFYVSALQANGLESPFSAGARCTGSSCSSGS